VIVVISMEAELVARCLTHFDAAIGSPVGCAVISSLCFSLPDRSKIFHELRRALESNRFGSVQDFLSRVEFVLTGLARDVGADSDLGLSLMTVNQLISEPLEPFVPRLTPLDRTPLTVVLAELRQFAMTAPNNLPEFATFLESGDTEAQTRILAPSKPHRNEPPFDEDEMLTMYDEILNLELDEEVEKVADIISRHETAYRHKDNYVHIDLRQCRPSTLKLLQGYLHSLPADREE
jgi:hypothetical protein